MLKAVDEGNAGRCPMGMAVLADGFKDLASSCPELSVKEQSPPVLSVLESL